MLLEQQISPKNPIFFTPSSPCLRPSGFARRGDHPPTPGGSITGQVSSGKEGFRDQGRQVGQIVTDLKN